MAASKIIWKAVALGSGLVAAKATRNVLDRAWARWRGGEPPQNPAAPGTQWKQAVAWSAVSGTLVTVARMLATQGAAAAWRRTTGKLPPGLEPAPR